MTGREKCKAALDHKSGPVPLDFGSTPVTGIHATVVEGLRKYYGLEKRPVKICEPYQMLGAVEEDLKRAMGVDVEGVEPEKNMFGFRNAGWKPWRTPWNQDVLVPEKFLTKTDGDAILIFPEGNTTVPPSAKLPGGGFFFDTIIRQKPIDEEKLNVEDNLQEFGLISDDALEYFRKACTAARATGRYVIANFGGTGLGDIALVPGPMISDPRGIRDITQWYMATAALPDYVMAIFEKQTEIALANLARVKAAVGDNVDAAFICGTDFGTQTSQFCSIDTFNTLWAPYYSKMNNWIHSNTAWKTFKHCCGAAEPFMRPFIESGFDIINPVQLSATGMDALKLKNQYGKSLTFWGGVVDTQRTLPFGTPEEVRAQVLERCQVFSREGGFVCNAIHNVQAKTPVANVVALVDALAEYNGKS